MFEIHVTVNTKDIGSFKKICKDIGVKPIILDLQDKTGDTVFYDMMTSSTCSDDPYVEAVRIKSELVKFGFNPIRLKIESSPSYVNVPNKDNKLQILKGNYFESHIRVITIGDRISELRKLCSDKAHVSRNIFKRTENGIQILLTIRNNVGVYEDFKTRVDETVALLHGNNFKTDKVEVEFVLFDSNKNHDSKWISS